MNDVSIVGAGPSGLTAALYLARAGVSVTVFEQAEAVGLSHRGSLQLLENWSTEEDALTVLAGMGIRAGFDLSPVMSATVLGPERRTHAYAATRPLFYRVRRGPEDGCLDRALLDQARQAGAVIRFGETVDRTDRAPCVIATGPYGHDGHVDRLDFETHHEDTCIGLLDDDLTPEGHSIILIGSGRGTMTSWRFRDLESGPAGLRVEMLNALSVLGISARQPAWFDHGIGYSMAPPFVRRGQSYLIGSRAGLIDALWGTGLRQAILSGVLAARSIVMGEDYDTAYAEHLQAWRESSVANRAIRRTVGPAGYEWLLDSVEGSNLMGVLRRHTLSSATKDLMRGILRHSEHPLKSDPPCPVDECPCVWCDHGNEPGSQSHECTEDTVRHASSATADLSRF